MWQELNGYQHTGWMRRDTFRFKLILFRTRPTNILGRLYLSPAKAEIVDQCLKINFYSLFLQFGWHVSVEMLGQVV